MGMKPQSLSPELRRRIADQIAQDEKNKEENKKSRDGGALARIQDAQPERAPKKALERSNPEQNCGASGPMLFITCISLRKKLLDAHDNKASSFKALTDQIAFELGMDDADPRIEWKFEQLTSLVEGTLVVFSRYE